MWLLVLTPGAACGLCNSPAFPRVALEQLRWRAGASPSLRLRLPSLSPPQGFPLQAADTVRALAPTVRASRGGSGRFNALFALFSFLSFGFVWVAFLSV